MAKHLLDRPEVCSALHHVGGRRMPKDVRREPSVVYPCRSSVLPHRSPDSLSRQPVPPGRYKEGSGIGGAYRNLHAMRQPAFNCSDGVGPDWHDSLLVPFPCQHHTRCLEVDVVYIGCGEFRNSAPSGIQEFKDRRVARANGGVDIGLIEHGCNFGD